MDINNKLLSTRLKKHIKEYGCLLDDIPVIIKASTLLHKIKETQPYICNELEDIIENKIYYYRRLIELNSFNVRG